MHNQTMNLHHAVTIFVMILALTALIIASIAISGDIDYKESTIPASAIKDHSKLFDGNTGSSAVVEDALGAIASSGKTQGGDHLHIDGELVTSNAKDLNMLLGTSELGKNNADYTDAAFGIPLEGVRFTDVSRKNLTTENSFNYIDLKAQSSLATNYTLELPAAAPTANQVLQVADATGAPTYKLGWVANGTPTGVEIATGDLTIKNTSNTTADTIIINHTGTGAAADSIAILSATGGIDIHAQNAGAGSDIDITATGSSVNITSTEADIQAIRLNASAATSGIDIDCGSQGIAIDTTGPLSIDSAGNASNISHTSGSDGQDFTIEMDASNNSSLVLQSAGTGSDSIFVHSSAGGVLIEADKNIADSIKLHSTAGASASAIHLEAAAGGVLVEADGNYSNAIKLHATAGSSQTIVLQNTAGTGANAIYLEAEAGGVLIEADGNVANAIKLHATAGSSQTIVLQNTAGTGANAIYLEAGAGGVLVEADGNVANAIKLHATTGNLQTISITNTGGTSASAINLEASAGGVLIASDGDIANAIKLHATAGTSQTITITNTGGTSSNAIDINADSGGISLNSAGASNFTAAGANLTLSTTTSGTLIINSAGKVDIDATGDIDITATGSSVNITSTEGVADAIHLNASNTAGGIDIDAGTNGVDIDSTGQISLVSTDTSTSSIEIKSSAGGVSIECADEKTVYIGNDDKDAYVEVAASTTTGSEVITIKNTNGTNGSAINIDATAGGIDLQADQALGVLFTGRLKQILSEGTNSGATYNMTVADVRNGLIVDNNTGAVTANLPSTADLINSGTGLLTRDNETVICYYMNKGTNTVTLTNNGTTTLFDSATGFAQIAADSSKVLIFRRVSSTNITVYTV